MKWILIEREKYAMDYVYVEGFKTLKDAQARMHLLYHENAVDGNEDAIEKTEFNDRSAYVIIDDGNEIWWNIEKV